MKKIIGLLIVLVVGGFAFWGYETFFSIDEVQGEDVYDVPAFSSLNRITYSPMGDSISNGAITYRQDQRFISVLADAISAYFNIEVNEMGVYKSGAKLSDLGISSVEQIKSQEPDFITIEYGTNDIKSYSGEESLTQFKANLSYVITELQEKNRVIVLVTTWNRDEKISQLYDDVIIQTGEKYGVPVANIRELWTERKDTIDPKSKNSYLGYSDKQLINDMHPNEFGHSEIARVIFETVKDDLAEYINTPDVSVLGELFSTTSISTVK
ncbi:SGNH/GDSL hydrolase family protein [Enterococcus sp. LJL51]|uniref:SGNH/GDSL hydrolase family protein n=1 Tax=Enterococcus sp. LJL51 TaxID=3416656 RepID=UPI003CF8D294